MTAVTEIAFAESLPVEQLRSQPLHRAVPWTDPVVLPHPLPRWLDLVNAGGDLLGLALAAAVALRVRGTPLEQLSPLAQQLTRGTGLLLVVPIVAVVHLTVLNAVGVSWQRVTRSALDEVPAVARGVSWAALLDLCVTFLLRLPTPRGLIVIAWLVGIVAVTVFRAATIRIRQRALRHTRVGVATVVVGHGPLAERAARELVAHPETGLRLVGNLGDQPLLSVTAPRLGVTTDLAQVVTSLRIGEVLVAYGSEHSEALAQAVWGCGGSSARVSVVAPHPDLVIPDSDHDRIGSLPLIHVRVVRSRRVARALRNLLDRVVALVLLTLALPAIGLVALAVSIDSPGGPFFFQTRVGQGGRSFRMVKLRTMVAEAESLKPALALSNEADGPLFKMREDPRVTRTGRLLRRSSFDEIPQLWHVVRGQMSLIGPRPPVPDEVARYPEWFRRRLAVRPGITGLWQVSGRAELPFVEAMRLDLSYVEGWSPWLDVQILLRTIGVVLGGRGSY